MSFPFHKIATLLTCLILASAMIPHANASLLRGVKDHVNNFVNNATFDCNVYDLDGMNPPEEEDHENQPICVIEETETHPEKTLMFDSDFQSKFGGIVLTDKTKMTIP